MKLYQLINQLQEFEKEFEEDHTSDGLEVRVQIGGISNPEDVVKFHVSPKGQVYAILTLPAYSLRND